MEVLGIHSYFTISYAGMYILNNSGNPNEILRVVKEGIKIGHYLQGFENH
jgi:hypothetical protein